MKVDKKERVIKIQDKLVRIQNKIMLLHVQEAELTSKLQYYRQENL